MASSTNSAENPATQGTQRCNGRFLFLENDESLNPFVAAGAPNRVVCIGVNLSRAHSEHLPQVLLTNQPEHTGMQRRIQGESGHVWTWAPDQTSQRSKPGARLLACEEACP